MLVKMICKNIDRKNMLLYALSMILSIVLDTFFLTALIVNDQYGLGEKAGNMDWLCTIFFLLAGVISVFFTLYSTGYYIRTKNGDYSLLMMLGGSRKTVWKFFSVEFLLIYLFSVASGLFGGGILSALFLAVLGICGYPLRLAPSDVLGVAVTVVKVSFLLFLIEYLAILLYFSKRNLSAVQQRGVKRERRHERTWFLVIVGIALLACAVNLLRRGGVLYEMISIVACLAGMYMVLSYGGSLILMILKAFQDFYCRNMIVLNEFYFKYKSNCRLLYMMFVLDFAVLFFTGGCVVSQIRQDVDSAEYPFGFVGVVQNSRQPVIEDFRELLGSDRAELTAIEGFIDSQGYKQTCFCISDRDYRRLTGRAVHLEETEAVFVNETTAGMEKPEIFYVGESGSDEWGERALELIEMRDEVVFGLEKPDCLREFAVVPESVIAGHEGDGYTIIAKKGNLQKEYEQYKEIFRETDADVFWRCAFLAEANENMTFVKIVSVFAGGFCVVACFALFALKVQGDIPSLSYKYNLLYQIGMTERAITKAIAREYGLMLAIPLALSALLSGFYMFAEMTGSGWDIRDYVCRYIPFQLVFLALSSVLVGGYMKKFCGRAVKMP